MMVVIWGVGQVLRSAAHWHDGQFAHRGHAVAANVFISQRRVGKANGSRERAPDDRLRVPTTKVTLSRDGGHGANAPLPILQ
jgi:hypothetical protein